MKALIVRIREYFKYNAEENIKFFANLELGDVNREIIQLQKKRDQLEYMVFGN